MSGAPPRPGSQPRVDDEADLVAAASTTDQLGDLLRRLRRREARRRGGSVLSYRDLAARTGWSLAAIGEYFAGRTLPPTERFDVLIGILGVTAVEQGRLATARDRVEEDRRRRQIEPAVLGGAPRQLPARIPVFSGRDHELSVLDEMAFGPGPAVPVCCISGTAGVGKTTLAVLWGNRVADRFPDGQLYLNLRGFHPSGAPVRPSQALHSLLGALGIQGPRIPADLDARAALFRSLVAGRRMLLVIDNAWDAGQVRPLLPGEAGCFVLVTCRRMLTGLVAADGARALPLEMPSAAEARDMLTRRLALAGISVARVPADEVVALCARLPLAIALVAARWSFDPGRPVTDLLAELRSPIRRLDALAGDDVATNVRSVLSWSYGQLTDAAARMFRLLGLHPGPDATTAAAASTAGIRPEEAAAAIVELRSAHLVTETGAGRCTPHDLLRAYAVELGRDLDSDTDRRDARRRLLDHYTATAHEAALRLNAQRHPVPPPTVGPGVLAEPVADHDGALAWFTAEHAVLCAAMADAAALGFDEHVWRLAWACSDYFDLRCHWQDWSTCLELAVASARRLGDREAIARTYHSLGRSYWRLDRADDALRAHVAALEQYEVLGDAAGQAHVLLALAVMHEERGHRERAVTDAERALRLYEGIGHRSGTGSAYNALGWHLGQLGRHREALEHCRQALLINEEVGNRNGQAATLDSIGCTHHLLGEYAAAAESFSRSIELYRQLGDRYNEADTLKNLGAAHHAAGDADAAAVAWRAALAILEHLRHPDAHELRRRLADGA